MKRGLISLWGVFLVVMASVGVVQADIQVRATVDRNQIAAGESIQLQVTVVGGDAEVDTSAIVDFAVHPRGTSSQIQFINGRMSKQVVYTYLLIPRGQGKLTIPALTADVGGKAYQTAPIAITVSQQTGDKPGDKPGDQQGDQGGNSRDVYVTARVSETSPFVGQQLIYTFSFFNAVQVTDARFQPPEFAGFAAKEITGRPSFRKTINGREFAVVEIEYVLVPLASGTAFIEPAVLQVGIVSRDGNRRRSPFDDFFDSPFLNRGSVTPRILQAQPLELKVQDLPPFQGAGAFSGLVGQFDLTADLENNRLQVGDSTTLTVTIKGRGNIMDAQLAGLDIPEGFKSYADAPQEEVQLGREGFSGQKVFRVALVPVKAGKYELPPLIFNYFDITLGRYQTLTLALPTVYVTPAASTESSPLLVTPQQPEPSKESVAFVGRDILPLKEELTALQPQRPLSGMAFILLLLGPGVAYGGVCFLQHFSRRDMGPAARMKAKAHQTLKRARSVLQDNPADNGSAFLSELYQALTAAIFSAVGRSGEALTWKEAEALLMESGLDQETAGHAAKVLSNIESAKFSAAGIQPDQARQLLADVQKLTRRLAP